MTQKTTPAAWRASLIGRIRAAVGARRKADVPNGVVLFEGPSVLNGEPIVVVATGLRDVTGNAKTGDMVQTWILHRDVAPHHAVKSGDDVAVCGDCKHRPANGGACYVTTFQAPLSVWKAYKRGAYPVVAPAAAAAWLSGAFVRFGSYGDPAAVPDTVWAPIRGVVAGYTGYTHQWRDRVDLDWLMASVDNVVEYHAAKTKGLRTFLVTDTPRPTLSGFKVRTCPASDESGINGVDCAKCRACDGISRGARRPDVHIVVHGARAKRFNG